MWNRNRRAVILAAWALAFCGVESARADVVNFDALGDGTVLSNQYPGLTFSNAVVLTAGISLNNAEFPPRSGSNVAYDAGGPVAIVFTTPVPSFSGYFTYTAALTIDAFDSLDQGVGTSNSLFTQNFVSSGNPTNELLLITFAGGISRVVITGDPGGSSFVMDDLTFASAVPEPSSGALITGAATLVVVWFRRRRA